MSVIETALWDLVGKAQRVPVCRLLLGKVRNRVRVDNGARRRPFEGVSPEERASEVPSTKSLPERLDFVKTGTAFHSAMKHKIPGFFMDEREPSPFRGAFDWVLFTERGTWNLTAASRP